MNDSRAYASLRRGLAVLAWAIMLTTALVLGGCTTSASSGSSSGASASSGSQAADAGPTAADAIALLSAAYDKPYASACFSTSTKASTRATTDISDQAAVSSQTVELSVQGEIDRSGDQARWHAVYRATASATGARTGFEAFVEGDDALIIQDETLFRESAAESGLDALLEDALPLFSKEQMQRIAELSSSRTIEQKDGAHVATMHLDGETAEKEGLINTGMLPEGSALGTITASFEVDADGHLRAIRAIAQTTTAPTCQLLLTCTMGDFDAAQLPEWPDVGAYLGYETAEDGTMYFVDDEGRRYLVDHVDDDGTVYYYADPVY